MIYADRVTDFNRTTAELEEFLLFGIAVAGKNADATAKGLDKLLRVLGFPILSPLQAIRNGIKTGQFTPELIRECGLGCYNQRYCSFRSAAARKMNLYACSVEDLEQIHGIGKKTSRFFMLHTRRDFKGAALDTHILKFLRSRGVQDVPTNTPGSTTQYRRLEEAFLKTVPPHMTVADWDLSIWNSYAGR